MISAASIITLVPQVLSAQQTGELSVHVQKRTPTDVDRLEPPINISLMHPISRNRLLPSLKHLCRFAILNRVRRDRIDELPVSACIRAYLHNPCYVAETTERRVRDYECKNET